VRRLNQCDGKLAAYLDGDNHCPPGKRQRRAVSVHLPHREEDAQRLMTGVWEAAARWAAIDLEAEGHAGPARVPPDDLRALVREGNR
jgi:hypothetical protein